MIKCEYNGGFVRIKAIGSVAEVLQELEILSERVCSMLSEASQEELVNISGTFDLKE